MTPTARRSRHVPAEGARAAGARRAALTARPRTGNCATNACAPIPRCTCFRSCCLLRSRAARSATARGGLDFDSGEVAFDKADIQGPPRERSSRPDAAVTTRWISDEELAANPGSRQTIEGEHRLPGVDACGLVRTIAGLDLQPCGGTHVARVGEIGRVRR